MLISSKEAHQLTLSLLYFACSLRIFNQVTENDMPHYTELELSQGVLAVHSPIDYIVSNSPVQL